MADKKKPTILPWGMSKEALQPNSVKGISQSKIKAFNVGRMNPLKKSSQYLKKKEDGEKKKMIEAKQTAEVFEEFVASFEDAGSSGKAFVRGSSSVKAAPTGSEMVPNPSGGSVYKPKSRFLQKTEEKPVKEEKSIFPSTVKKPPKKKGTEKKKTILELFREELKRSQDSRRERRAQREAALQSSTPEPVPPPSVPLFNVEEYTDATNKGSFDTGDPLTTNLYVGNINPKMNEDNLCQLFGKFGPLASVKVMWPRTEEEKARNKNCGFVAYMKREDAEKALDHFKGTKIMDYEIQIGWGKAVRVPPQPIYVPPDKQEEEIAKIPDPPSGLPFNAQTVIPVVKVGDGKSGATDSAADHSPDDIYGDLYNAVVRVVIPTDIDLLKIIHRMIEFVIREGPMFEAMIMNRELNNPTYQFLFDNRSPAHIYYRWKLFSILQGDSPETWKVEEFRMFERGSLWKPPPLKCLRSKVLPPVDDQIARRGQLSSRQRDELEHMLRHITMEREKIKTAMVWCLDHSDSAEEISECICEALSILETPLPTKVARLYLVSDILVNCSSNIMDSMNFRREFEGKLLSIVEHFHMVMISIKSRMKMEQYKRRVLKVLQVWDNVQVYHYNVVDKMRLTFIGKTTDDMEKQKAFDTVAALIGAGPGTRVVEEKEEGLPGDSLDGVPLAQDRVLDFELGDELDGQPLDGLDGEPLLETVSEGGAPASDTSKEKESGSKETGSSSNVPVVKSKWELVDYGDDSDESEEEEEPAQSAAALAALERQKLLAEVAERKRKILRDVEVKAMELYDALESSGSYSKDEIAERVDKYREKLMQEAVEPKFSPPRYKDKKARSPSPTSLDKYHLDVSPRSSSKKKSSTSVGKSKHEDSSHSRSPRRHKRSPSPDSPVERKLYSSKSKRSRSNSAEGKRHSRSPISPASRRSKSPISPASRRSKSWSPSQQSQSTSPTPKRSRRSPSPPSKSSGKSRSPVSGSGRSQSPLRRSRSRSPVRSSRRSRSPAPRSYRRSRSPASGSKRSRSPGRRSRSRSPARSSRRSRSPGSRSRKRSRSPRGSRRSRSPRARRHSPSPVSRSRRRSRSRSRSRSPARGSKKSRSPGRRSRSRSPGRSLTSRKRSKSPKSSKRRSSPKSSKKSKKRSRSRSPHKSKKKSKH